jgi:8-oxo-dGTP pyrophosphatase MutT (NUDIX family)
MSEIPEARPASTVVLLRDTERGLETLLLKRNKALMCAGGLWVFPGGAFDPEDMAQAGGDEYEAARIAAAREAEEEAGLQTSPQDMVQFSHWTTPIAEPKRFATWFFVAPVPTDQTVVIDGSEIHDASWMSVREAVAAHEGGELGMLPPTYITLCAIASYDTLDAVMAALADGPFPDVFPVFGDDQGQLAVMFRGDAGYDSGDASAAGARHRAVLDGERWRYQYRDVAQEVLPLMPLDTGVA